MEYTTLGSTGTRVSRICLGCMSFGGDAAWKLDEKESKRIVDRAIDLGINFFDTANVYQAGESEEILGDILSGYDRDWPVVATKVHPRGAPSSGDNPNAGGLSRKAIEQELEHSLERLGMETIDLYQIHRWDYDTPVEETLKTLDDAVRRGKVRHIGASSTWAYQLSDALHTSDRLGLERFQTMQNHYNLAYREEEREMLPLCVQEGVGSIPWSPLARGYLARPHEAFESTSRGQIDAENMSDRMASYHASGGPEINERVEELAEEKDVSMAQISLAWLLHQDAVDAPIIGVSSVEHVEDAAEAVDISLSNSEQEYLEEPYRPVAISGHY